MTLDELDAWHAQGDPFSALGLSKTEALHDATRYLPDDPTATAAVRARAFFRADK